MSAWRLVRLIKAHPCGVQPKRAWQKVQQHPTQDQPLHKATPRSRKQWQANMPVRIEVTHCDCAKTDEEAAKAYDTATSAFVGMTGALCNAQVPRRRFSSRQRTSRFMGVGSSNRKNQWQARILVHGKVTHLGYYETEEDAAKVYDRVSISLHGQAAQTNFPLQEYQTNNPAEYSGLEREDLQRALGVKPMDKSSKWVPAANLDGMACFCPALGGGHSLSAQNFLVSPGWAFICSQHPLVLHLPASF